MHSVAGIAHEALLTHRPRLRELLDKDREFLRARPPGAAAAEPWRRESRDVDFLLHEGKPLAEARELLNTGDLELVKENSDLDALRGRDDFKKLVSEIEARTKTN